MNCHSFEYFCFKGELLTYSRWKDGEGGTTWLLGKQEECATISGRYSWQWVDVDCDDSNYVVCETYAEL